MILRPKIISPDFSPILSLPTPLSDLVEIGYFVAYGGSFTLPDLVNFPSTRLYFKPFPPHTHRPPSFCGRLDTTSWDVRRPTLTADAAGPGDAHAATSGGAWGLHIASLGRPSGPCLSFVFNLNQVSDTLLSSTSSL